MLHVPFLLHTMHRLVYSSHDLFGNSLYHCETSFILSHAMCLPYIVIGKAFVLLGPAIVLFGDRVHFSFKIPLHLIAIVAIITIQAVLFVTQL